MVIMLATGESSYYLKAIDILRNMKKINLRKMNTMATKLKQSAYFPVGYINISVHMQNEHCKFILYLKKKKEQFLPDLSFTNIILYIISTQ